MSEARFRYDASGEWLKGNTHIHSVASDGGKGFSELAAMYSAKGYDFLFRTDHWVVSNVADDETLYPLTWIDGVELDGRDSSGAYYHIVSLGRGDIPAKENGLDSCLRAVKEQGALLILAHPHWSGNSLDDVVRHPFDGVEIYNHVCRWLNGKSDGLVHWERALSRNPETIGLAVDDAHIRSEHPGWNGGWIVVNSADRSPAGIIEAIRRGNFYSSCGPEIRSISFDGERVKIETSPVKFARLAGPGSLGARTGSFYGDMITEAEFKIPSDWKYSYIDLEDDRGRRAWTNNLILRLNDD